MPKSATAEPSPSKSTIAEATKSYEPRIVTAIEAPGSIVTIGRIRRASRAAGVSIIIRITAVKKTVWPKCPLRNPPRTPAVAWLEKLSAPISATMAMNFFIEFLSYLSVVRPHWSRCIQQFESIEFSPTHHYIFASSFIPQPYFAPSRHEGLRTRTISHPGVAPPSTNLDIGGINTHGHG